MLVGILIQLALCAPPTATEAPRPKGIVFTVGGNTVVTPPQGPWEFRRIDTPAGPRIQLKVGGTAIETTELRIDGLSGRKSRSVVLRPSPDGSLSHIEVTPPRVTAP